MKIINKIFTTILLIISLFLLVLFLFIMFSKYIKKEEFPNICGYTYMQVKSESMYSALKANDIIIIKLSSSYEVGDIVTYKSGKNFITHRIIDKEEKYVITKGDSNNFDDGEIDNSRIIGKVSSIISGKIYKIIKYVSLAIFIFVILDIFIRKDK